MKWALTYAKATTYQVTSVNEASGLPWLFNNGAVTGDLPDINVWLAFDRTRAPAPRRRQSLLGQRTSQARDRKRPVVLPRLHAGLGAIAVPTQSGGRRCAEFDARCGSALSQLIKPSSDAAPFPARLWTAAYLAAVAQSSGARLVSFDQDFGRFGLENFLLLSAS